MESAASIRSQPLVAKHDTTDVFAEYGVKVADPQLLAKAQALVDAVVKQADTTIDIHFKTYKAIPQNPYLEHAVLDGTEVPHATVVRLQDAYDFRNLAAAMLGEQPEGHFDLLRINELAITRLGELLKAHHYELAAVQRNRAGQGIGAIAIRDPIYFQKALEKEARAANDQAVKLRGDIGFRSTCTTTELRAARAVADEFCNEALTKVGLYLRTTSAGGSSPFGEDSPSIENYASIIVDKRRVVADRHNRVANGVVIVVGYGSDLAKRLSDRVGARAKLDTDTFFGFVMLNIAERLRERPELMGALVGYTVHRDASYTEDRHFKVICSPAPPAPPPPPPTLYERVVSGLLAPFAAVKRSISALLPAPAPAPQALPPPPPEVVPPVTVDRFSGPK